MRTDYDGQAERLTDLARITLLYEDWGRVAEAVGQALGGASAHGSRHWCQRRLRPPYLRGAGESGLVCSM